MLSRLEPLNASLREKLVCFKFQCLRLFICTDILLICEESFTKYYQKCTELKDADPTKYEIIHHCSCSRTLPREMLQHVMSVHATYYTCQFCLWVLPFRCIISKCIWRPVWNSFSCTVTVERLPVASLERCWAHLSVLQSHRAEGDVRAPMPLLRHWVAEGCSLSRILTRSRFVQAGRGSVGSEKAH